MRVMPQLQARLRKMRLPHLEVVAAGSGVKKPKSQSKLQLVAIPLLKSVAVAHGEKGGSEATELLEEAQIESMIAAPKDWCPNPSTTSCVRVRGSSMSPLILDGYILAVDSAQTEINELSGKIVIAWHRERGLTVSRLNRFDHTIVLQSENANYESITLGAKQKWKIVAKVLWWIGKAP